MPFVRAILGMTATLALVAVLFFACWVMAAGCSRAHILVRNQSGTTLSNLTISGSCEQRHVDTVGDHSEWQTATPYRKGGQIQFSFLSGAKRYSSSPEIYTNHSGSCGITLTVLSNMTVESEVKY